ncbi:RNA polymerase sigma factor [Sphingobacterium gobiense]|uniref:RNA polymerase subunit sigma-70 n=1 Tax=Sphingobacterium gobiense TaxID=1382456 RepID=A0A2S9JU74_9SPHI|nr:RNA polymerase sigma-70 factor [Sphingobacterium gobiense]PRD56835.1 RNA polymerase subunit sigma-70 [Sphingobacterium gobiense]
MRERGAYSDDVQLVLRINAGDHRAFDELFSRYKEALYRHAYRMIPDTEVCNDIIQDVFLTIWAKHKTWHIKTSAISYLYQAVRNKVLDHISHEKVIDKYLGELADFERNGQCYTEESVLERELLALIEENKSNLPPRTREVFEMNREQQLSYREIGEKLSISETTAKKQVHNALRYLRTKLTALLFSILFLLFSIL